MESVWNMFVDTNKLQEFFYQEVIKKNENKENDYKLISEFVVNNDYILSNNYKYIPLLKHLLFVYKKHSKYELSTQIICNIVERGIDKKNIVIFKLGLKCLNEY